MTVTPAADRPVLVVGAGLSGAVIAHELAQAGRPVQVIDARPHVAGNCHTDRCPQTGVLTHVYGPHIFHTDDGQVWDYVSRFATFLPYRHQVRSTVRGQVYSMPVNLLTINQFFGTALSPDQARQLIADKAVRLPHPPRNFHEQALHFMGPELYEAFFRGYTEKQWGCDPRDLPASVLQRLPLRFSYDDNYFFHRYQGLPEQGYTAMTAAMLRHPLIRLRLSTPWHPDLAAGASHVVWSGPLDEYHDFRLGRLAYRTLDFQRFTHRGDYQGCAVMNYGDRDIPQTRITEHKHFSPWEQHEDSVLYREFSRAAQPGDIPYYPIRLVQEKQLLGRYMDMAQAGRGVTFVGRLGTYRYLDMDVTIREALDSARMILEAQAQDRPVPAFLHPPI